MTSVQRRLLWGSTTVTGLLIVGASILLGLEKASMLGGILGSILGLLSAAIGIYQIMHDGNQRSQRQASTPRQVQRSGNQSINIQSGNDVSIGDNNRFGQP
jgi:hypothetical protein